MFRRNKVFIVFKRCFKTLLFFTHYASDMVLYYAFSEIGYEAVTSLCSPRNLALRRETFHGTNDDITGFFSRAVFGRSFLEMLSVFGGSR